MCVSVCVFMCLLVKAQMAEFVGWDQGEVERVTSRLQCKSRNGIQIISLASRQIYPLRHVEDHTL